MKMNGKKEFMKVIRKESVEVEFRNISFAIEKKQILHSVSGKFSPGQLIAILGASGAGKTTLLNVLTGQLLSGFSGEVLINNVARDMRKFRKISSYIMQEDSLQPFLTVEESMSIASRLKLGKNYSREQKLAVIQHVLSVMGLDNCLNMRVEKLSGGERKRLILALELINNPPIMFLDEPTSGLDNVSIKKCVEMLKSLTSQVLELLHFNPTNTSVLSKEIENGKKIVIANELQTYKKEVGENYDIDTTSEYPVSVFEQFTILLHRQFMQQKRNKVVLFLKILHHLMCGLFLGMLFYDVGNSGTKSYVNIHLYLGSTLFLLFTHLLGPILVFPEEIKLLQREYSNRWYSLKACFAALLISGLPIMILTTLLILVYPMACQPMEFQRFLWFLLINILMSLTADGCGHAIGSVLNPLHGGVVGSAFCTPLVLAAVYDLGHGDTSSYLSRILVSFSFPYNAWVALTTSMLNDRKSFSCEEIFCYFGDPKFLLKKMGLEGRDQYIPTLILLTFFIVFKASCYAFLRFRFSQQYVLIGIKLNRIIKLLKLDQ